MSEKYKSIIFSENKIDKIPPIHKNGQNGIFLTADPFFTKTNMPIIPPMRNESRIDNIPSLKFKNIVITKITNESPNPNHFIFPKIKKIKKKTHDDDKGIKISLT